MGRGIAFVAVAALLVLAGSALQLRAIWLQPLALPKGGAIITISRGESLQHILRRVQDQQWVSHGKWVGWIARWHGMDQQVKAGEYQLKAPLAASELIQMLAAGAGWRSAVQRNLLACAWMYARWGICVTLWCRNVRARSRA